MAVGNYSLTVTIGGVSIAKSVSRSGDHPNPYGPITLPAGKVVTSWVKTDANTAACNLPSGHGYTNGNFDVYWTAGGVDYVRYGVPGTITVNALALDGGDGTDFPASATVGIVVCKQVQINTAIDGDASELLALSLESSDPASTGRAHVDFQDVSDVQVADFNLYANVPLVYDIGSSAITNPVTGEPIVVAYASNGSSSEDLTLYVLSLEDSSP